MRAADVIDLATSSSLENGENPTAIVFHMQPVALLFAVAVDWKRYTLEGIRDHQRQKLFGKLEGAIIVGRTSDQRGEFVGAHVGTNQEVRGSLGSGVGATRLEGKIFAGERIWSDVAINFVGRNVNEARYGELTSHLQESEGS